MRAVRCIARLTHPDAAKSLTATLRRKGKREALAKASAEPGRRLVLRPAKALAAGDYRVVLTVRNRDGSTISPVVALRVG